MEAYVQDVRVLVGQQLEEAARLAGDDAQAPGAWMKTRLMNYRRWKRLAEPLNWGEDNDTWQMLSRAVSSSQERCARGLPPSTQRSCSRRQFVDRIYRASQGHTTRSATAPVWARGTFWPVLHTVVAECQILLGSTMTEAEQVEEIKMALEDAVERQAIHFFPDSVGASRQPSMMAWTTIAKGSSARRVASGVTRTQTRSERLAADLQQASQTAKDEDVHSEWFVGGLEIQEYHKYMKHENLPTEWNYGGTQVSGLAAEIYEWAQRTLSGNVQDWRCQLALTLAFLVSKLCPHVFWPTRGGEVDQVKSLLHGVSTPADGERSIGIMRQLPWVLRAGVKGVKEEGLYFTQMSTFILAWVHSESPLHRKLQRGVSGQLGDDWVKKHCELYSVDSRSRN